MGAAPSTDGETEALGVGGGGCPGWLSWTVAVGTYASFMHAEVPAWPGVSKQRTAVSKSIKGFHVYSALICGNNCGFREIATVCSAALPGSQRPALASVRTPELPAASQRGFLKEGQFPVGLKAGLSFSWDLHAGFPVLGRRPGALEKSLHLGLCFLISW